MRISKTEVNLRRLLAAAPQQQNQAKLVHVCMILVLRRVSKTVLSDYSEKIEAIASKLAAPPILDSTEKAVESSLAMPLQGRPIYTRRRPKLRVSHGL